MDGVFNIIPCKTVTLLESKIQGLFNAQVLVDTSTSTLTSDPTESTYQLAVVDAVSKRVAA